MKEWLSEFKREEAQKESYVPVKNALSIAMANEFEELGPMDQDDMETQDGPVSKLDIPEMDPKLAEPGAASLVADALFCYEHLRLLVDFFYLPHQRGETAMGVLERRIL